MIEVKDLVKKYGDHVAVDHLSFHLKPGKIYGFLGPNGAGKSTTMNIMTGYLGATEGQVFIDGYDILKEPEQAKKCIGYLPEIPPLYTDMTVMEYLEFAAELKRIPGNEREKQIKKVIELTKLEMVSQRLIRNLSKGYKQRVGLAQALLGFPDIIILDEPTVGLDPKQIIEIRELIRSLSEKHTVILSSHILAEVREVCDYILIISNGKLVASDTPDNLEQVMHGTESLEIESTGSMEQTEHILQEMGCAENIQVKVQKDKTVYARFDAKGGEDIREKVFLAFAENQCPLVMLKTTKASLEDVFMELTQGDSAETRKCEGVQRDSVKIQGKERDTDDSDL